MNDLKRSLFPKNINPDKDTFLGETSVQIHGFSGQYPSIHLVRSYMIEQTDREDCFYHIFEHKTGTSAVNYGPKEYEQVTKFIDISNYWTIFYKDSKDNFFTPISKSYRYESEEV